MTPIVQKFGYFNTEMRVAGKILLLAVLAFGLVQCENDIELEFESFQPKLVINAQISADSGFVVTIGSSTTPVNPDPGDIPEDLTVTLTDLSLGEPIDLYRENDLFVTGPSVTVVPGRNYLIKAMAPGYEPVQAVTSVPEDLEVEQVSVQDFKVTVSEVTPEKKNISYTLSFSFEDSDEEYLHFLFTQHTTLTSGGVNGGEQKFEYALTPEFPEESGFTRHVDNGVLVSLNDVPSRTVTFRFNDYTIDALNEVLGDLEVEIRTVSPDYYKYFVSLSQQLETLKDPFAEPVPVFSNVNGGLGNFSSYSSRIITLTLL